jgi:hypothetical protein
MDSRVTANAVRVTAPATNVAAANNAPAANNGAPAAANTAVNTADAAQFSGPDPFSLADLGRMVNELETRIKELEAHVTSLTGSNKPKPKPAPSGNGPVLPPGVKLPPLPVPQATANTPAANAPANNAPATNAPANNVPATNAPANNVPAANAPVANAPAATATGSKTQIEQALGQLQELQTYVTTRISDIEKLLRAAQATDGKGAAEKDDLDRQQAGLQAVSHVLKEAKLKNLTPAEEAVVNPAVKRVHEIATAIAGGDSYNQHAAELFVLRNTLMDPANAGNHKAVTGAAQLVGQINNDKTTLAKTLETAKGAELEGAKALYKSLVDIEKGLEGAKLIKLTPDAEKKALDAINKLGEIRDGLVGGTIKPADAEAEIFRLSQALKAPTATAESQQVKSGAEVLKQIAEAKKGIQKQLAEIDAKVIGGAAPEQFAGARQELLARAESLTELGEVVKGAKLEQTNPQAKREVEAGLQRASEIAKGLGKGESPSKYRAETFVLKQTFQEPLASKDNPAVQSGAGALQLLGRAEAANLKKQTDIAAKIAKGAEPRQFDAEVGKLRRQAEDLETIRHAIETANLGGLNDKQEIQGAKLIDQIRDIGMKVANGEDFKTHEKAFDDAVKQLKDLKNFGVEAPKPPAAEPPKTTLEPGAVYSVKNGDFLTKIAREKLGDPNRFKDIIELNKDKYPSLVKNPDLIYPGWTLVLPKQ